MKRDEEVIQRDGYHDVASHIPALALAMKVFGPDVLEIGCGWYSTPLIHALSGVAVSFDDSPDWVGKFQGFAQHGRIAYRENLVEAAKKETRPYRVVFIDCAAWDVRLACAEYFLEKYCCVVAHDTDAGYWKSFLASKKVKYQTHFGLLSPRTSWLSNTLDVTRT